jgi:NADPH-dependent curcumin reductase CurA
MTAPLTYKEFRLRSRPDDHPTIENFELCELPLPSLGDGEVQVRNLWMSIDPYMRGRMKPGKSYAARYEIGEVMHGGAIGVVERSRSPDFAEGDIVRSMCGWREAFVASASVVSRFPTLDLPRPILELLACRA